MLSYRHSFHAGNHADVLKHIVLMLILENLSLKEKGFYYLDTHSGVGRYRLSSNESEKTGEYKEGIGRLWDKTDLPAEVARYVDLIKKLNYGGKELRYYAGSPMIAAQLLRPQDRALLTELHPSDFPLLRNNFKEFKNITTKSENTPWYTGVPLLEYLENVDIEEKTTEKGFYMLCFISERSLSRLS